jgi:hypothetical protein
VSSIRSREVARTQRPSIWLCEDALEALDFGNSSLGVHSVSISTLSRAIVNRGVPECRNEPRVEQVVGFYRTSVHSAPARIDAKNQDSSQAQPSFNLGNTATTFNHKTLIRRSSTQPSDECLKEKVARGPMSWRPIHREARKIALRVAFPHSDVNHSLANCICTDSNLTCLYRRILHDRGGCVDRFVD